MIEDQYRYVARGLGLRLEDGPDHSLYFLKCSYLLSSSFADPRGTVINNQ